MKQYDTNERMMYLNEIRISIEIENDDYSKRDELFEDKDDEYCSKIARLFFKS